jgi:peptidoglycan/LPS O-acetylase OafA/YrhL
MLQFRRITTQGRFIPQIDGLRFVAITSVVLFHIYANFENGLIPAKWIFDPDLPKRGVELFFAISGFILGVPFATHFLRQGQKVNLKQYFLRRLTRLEPPYLICLIVFTVDQVLVAHRSFHELGPHLLASSVYLHNLIYGAFNRPINGVAWSLEIEVQFYVLVPLLALMFAISNPTARRTVVAALMLGFGFLGRTVYPNPHLRASIVYYLAFFLAGFLLCDLYVTRREWTRSYQWDVLAICLWPLVWVLGRNSGHILLPFVIVVLYLAAFRGRMFSALFSNPVITSIGGMCYSIYLFHTLVIGLTGHATRSLHVGQNFWVYFGLQSVLIYPVVLLLCGTFFLLIERPCMDRNWPRKLWNQVKTLSSAPEQRAAEEAPTVVPAPLPDSAPNPLPAVSAAPPSAD